MALSSLEFSSIAIAVFAFAAGHKSANSRLMTGGNFKNYRGTKKACALPATEPPQGLSRSLLKLLVSGPAGSGDQALQILLLRDPPAGSRKGRCRR
jgi:hypothetical protein